jgi:uncharacterized membrane protein
MTMKPQATRNKQSSRNSSRRRPKSPQRPSYMQNDLASQFPSPSILQEYEYAAEGTVERIFKMAEDEQQQRHLRQENAISFQQKARQSGQVFGIFTLIIVILGVLKLALSGHEELAELLVKAAFFAFVFFAFFSFLVEGGKRNKSRNARRKHNDQKKT